MAEATVFRSPVRSRFVVTDWMVLLLVVLTLAGMVAGSALMAAPGILVLCMVGLGRLWTHLALLDLRYHACVSRRRVMIGDTIEIVVTVENHKPLPISWLRVVDAIPSGLEIESEGSDAYRVRNGFETQVVTRLGPYQRLRITHRVRAAHRGVFHIGSARLSASDPFGLYESGMQVASAPDTVVVYPASMALSDPPVPMLRPLGDHVSRFALSADRTRPSGTREYRAGDPARDIDWKSSAKRDRLFVRTYDASVTGHVLIALDCEMGRTGPWLARVEMLERGVRVAASLAAQLDAGRYGIGLVGNGDASGERGPILVPAGRGPMQLAQVLEGLAGVQPVIGRGAEETVLSAGAAMRSGCTVVYLTGVVRRPALERLRLIAERGCAVVVGYTGLEDPPILGDLAVLDFRERSGGQSAPGPDGSTVAEAAAA